MDLLITFILSLLAVVFYVTVIPTTVFVIASTIALLDESNREKP